MRVFGAIALVTAALTWGEAAHAQTGFPDKPIKLIVPFPAGGGADVLARTVASKMSDLLGQRIVVENRAGAGGNIGTAAGARSAPDGYTVIYGTNGTLAINPSLYSAPGFDAAADLEPIARLTEIALVVVAHPTVPAASLAELIAHARSNPGKLNVATAGSGTTSHLASELFKKAAGVDWLNVHYRGGAEAMIDLMSGQVQVMIEIMANAMPRVEANTLKGLAVSTPERWPRYPGLPTIAESGVPGFAVTAWDALLAPKGTPAEIVHKLNAATVKALGDEELQKTLLARGAKVVPSPPSALRALMQTEFKRWGDVVRESGAKID